MTYDVLAQQQHDAFNGIHGQVMQLTFLVLLKAAG